MSIDFNNAGPQRGAFEPIPAGTICLLHMVVRRGEVGDGSWLTAAKDNRSKHLNTECTVVGGDHDGRRLWSRLTVEGVDHAKAIKNSFATLGAILESARGVRPDDTSDAAKAARTASWGDFHGLYFWAELGIEPGKNGYEPKNTIKEVITPDMPEWKQPPAASAPPAGEPASAGGSGVAAPAQQTTPPASAIARPYWAQPEGGK